MSGASPPGVVRAEALLAWLQADGATVAVAESLTGGLVVAALTSVPGSSAVVRGAVIAYATDVKASLLRVDPDLLDREGPVHAQVAAQMARNVATVLGATYGLATTGEAGPESASGRPVGTIHVAVSGPGTSRHRQLHAAGDRASIRQAAMAAVLELLTEVLAAGGARTLS